MPIGELGYNLSTFLVYLFMFVSSIYGTYAVYYAYFKTKDERQKYIVLQSTALAFTVLLIYFIVEMVVKFAEVAELTMLWDLMHFGISASIASGMMSILGTCLFINKRKAGG